MINAIRSERMRRVVVAALLSGAVVLACSFDGGPFTSYAVAQGKQKPEGKRTEALSQAGFEKLTAAQLCLEAENYGCAISTLGGVIAGGGSYKQIDIATALKFRGYAYAGQDNYAAAAKDFEAAINTGALSDIDSSDLRYNLAQLYLGLEQNGKAVQYLEEWLRSAENPGPPALFFAAQLYLVVEQPAKAETYADQGMQKIQVSGEVQENWLRIASVVYLQREKYSKAQPVLERLVAGWPDKKDYYIQLGAVYGELNREKDSFAMLALAYENNLPLTSDEIMRLAQLYRFYEYPFKAAKILEKEIQSGRVKQTKATWEELGNSWFQARDMKKAIDPLTKAASLSGDGEIYLRVCQTHIQEENWEKAARECANAVNKGGLKTNGGLAYQLLAISRYEQGNREGALDAFGKCQDWEQTADNCLSWQRHVRDEIATEKAEEERRKLAEQDVELKKQMQEEEIQRTLQGVRDVFGDQAVGRTKPGGSQPAGTQETPPSGETTDESGEQ
jgi:tetratricopeptide (TPR) repeat protein